MWVDICTIPESESGAEGLDKSLSVARNKGLDGLLVVLNSLEDGILETLETIDAGKIRLFAARCISCQGAEWLVIPPSLDLLDSRAEDSEWELGDLEKRVEEGWAVVISQPFDGGPGEDVFRIRGLDGVEVATGAENLLQRELALEAALVLDVPAIAGARCAPEKLGNSGIVFLHPPSSQREFVQRLKGREVYVVRRGAPPEASGAAQEGGGRRRSPRKRSRKKKEA